MDSMEYHLSKFKNDIANQFGHNVFYKKVLIRVFYYLLEKRINTRILFFMTTYHRLLALGGHIEIFEIGVFTSAIYHVCRFCYFINISMT